MKKQMTIWLLLAVTIISLVGCGAKNETAVDQNDATIEIEDTVDNEEPDAEPEPVSVSGTIEEITIEDGDEEGYLLVNIGEDELMHFNFDADTSFDTGVQDLKALDKIEITYSGNMTKSIPAQAYAEKITLK